MSPWTIIAGASLAVLFAVIFHAGFNSPICPQPYSFPSTPTSTSPYNDLLQGVEKLGEGKLPGPEALSVDEKEGFLYTATRDGWIKRLRLNGGSDNWEEWMLVGGQALLGIAVSKSSQGVGGLLVCDASKGLLKVDEQGVTTLTSEVAGTKIRFADDVVEASDGSIYFSDASTKFGFPHGGRLFYDFLEAVPHGRLLKYDPATNKTSIVLADLAFANGVTMSLDQNYLVVCETWRFRCLKHWLKGEKEGQTEVLVDNLPGGPDNINLAPDGSFWIALLEMNPKGFKWIHSSVFAKKLAALFPKIVEKILKPVGVRAAVVKVTADGKIDRVLDDGNGRVISFITTALEYDGNLYLGSLGTDFVGRLSLRNQA